MITYNHILSLFMEACPSLVADFNQRQAFWASSGDDGGPYPSIELGLFANHFVELRRQGRTQELDAGFEVLERLYAEGDASVQKAVTVNFVEDLVAQRDVDPDTFLPYLRPLSRAHWEEERRWWAGGSPNVRAETGAA